MRILTLFTLLSLLAGPAQAQSSAVAYSEVNYPARHEVCDAIWQNRDGVLGLKLFAQSSGNSGAPVAAEVISFDSPKVLGAQPPIAFAVKYLSLIGSGQPFLRIEYQNADGGSSYATIPFDHFRQYHEDNGYYYHILNKPLPMPNAPVKRMALIARGAPLLASVFFVRFFHLAGQQAPPRRVAPPIVDESDRLVNFLY